MRKNLYRSQTNKVLAGVCGGIAEHIDVDPVLVRLIFILLTFATGLGPGIIIYIIAWVVIPKGPVLAPAKPLEPDTGTDEPTEV